MSLESLDNSRFGEGISNENIKRLICLDLIQNLETTFRYGFLPNFRVFELLPK
ncbi:hypothetical protein Cal6303_2967 [Calothrix sp. PCC 6303]|nr:hypothetical protein Cal6303_2967 [Calothrix sp. PCC 6303]